MHMWRLYGCWVGCKFFSASHLLHAWTYGVHRVFCGGWVGEGGGRGTLGGAERILSFFTRVTGKSLTWKVSLYICNYSNIMYIPEHITYLITLLKIMITIIIPNYKKKEKESVSKQWLPACWGTHGTRSHCFSVFSMHARLATGSIMTIWYGTPGWLCW